MISTSHLQEKYLPSSHNITTYSHIHISLLELSSMLSSGITFNLAPIGIHKT